MTKTPDGSGKLFRWELNDQSLVQCLAFAAGPLERQCDKGFAYTAGSCRFCVVDVGEDGSPVLREQDKNSVLSEVDINSVFELRLFGEYFELRWVRTDGHTGLMSICTENADFAKLLVVESLAHFKLPEVKPDPVSVRWLDHDYLLWGMASENVSTGTGWTYLTSARIGGLWVPKDNVGSKARLTLKAREYFTVADAGNVVFAGERLVGFAEVKDTKAKGNGEANVQ